MFRQLLAFVFLFTVAMPNAQTQVGSTRPLIETLKGEQAIELQSLKIESNISGGLAETTVRMTFFNSNNRPLEGNLQFPLLEGQQITAFALDMNGKMRQAVPVEKAKGRQVFEEIERRGVDPGLLENTQGNNFKLRIYPIAAKGIRTVELRYSESLKRSESNWLYILPMAFGEHLKDFELSVITHGVNRAPRATGSFGDLAFKRQGKRFEALVTKSNYSPNGILALQIPASDKPQTYTQRFNGQSYFLAEVPIASVRHDRRLPGTVGLLWDSSGSGEKRNHDLEFALLDRYFRKASSIEVRLIRLRDRAEKTETFKVSNGDWSSLKMNLANTVYDGASALSQWQVEKNIGEYLLFSDGLGNYDNAPFPDLADSQRLYTINSAASADATRLAALAEQNGGRYVSLQANVLEPAVQALLTEGLHLERLDGEGLADLEFSSRDPQDGLLRIAGRILAPNAKLSIILSENAKKTTLQLPIDSDSAEHSLAASLWASYRLRSLDADHELNRAAIRRIGEQFAMPTRETSLIVLDTVADYVRYEILPPEELHAEYAQLIGERDLERKENRDEHLAEIVENFEEKYAWWNKVFPKGNKPQAKADKLATAAMVMSPPPAPGEPAPIMLDGYAADAAAAAPEQRANEQSGSLDAIAVTGSRLGNAEVDNFDVNSGSTISLKKWTSDAPYIARMKAASSATIYAIYLDEKPAYLNSSAFFLDAADMLLEKNQRDLALRVLSNLAEMDLENRQILRILGYRLMQAGAPELAIPVFEKVQQLAEEEPQSFRDLGLAYAAAGQNQKAIEQLYEVVLRPWDGRFAEIELIALAELNGIIATSKQKLDTSSMDSRLLKAMPLDLRVILTWDADNSDMDLWVTDPNGEKCFYGNKLTYQGGRMSDDFTGGYGPEEFSLRKAKTGKYKIEANFFGNRQQVVAGATTLQVYLTTGFGTAKAKQQSVTLRLKDAQETVFVGEFEVKP